MKNSFVHQKSPMIVGVIRERTARDAINAICNSTISGAKGFDLHLSCLEESEKTIEKLRTIISSTDKPIMALEYNESYDRTNHFNLTDDERMKFLLSAVRAGAAAVDMQGYTFDQKAKTGFIEKNVTPEMIFAGTKPCEVTLDYTAIKKQIDFINKVHSLNAEVVLSTHTLVPMNCEQVISMAKFLEKRGADLLKIVTPCENDDQLSECFKTTLTLKKELHTKYSYHCCGAHSKASRIICPMLGSYLIFCTESYTKSSHPEQLHLRTMIEAFRTLDWRM